MEFALEWPGGRIILDQRRVAIGRLLNNQITLDDTQISGTHAEIIPTAYGILLIDLGSRNGTFVNGHRLIPDVPYVLQSGDRILIGRIEFRFWIRVTPPQQPPYRR